MAVTSDEKEFTTESNGVSAEENETRDSHNSSFIQQTHHNKDNEDDHHSEQQQLPLQNEDVVNSNNPLKIVVVGDGTVGKTCMCIAYTQGVFMDNEYVPTVFENYTGIQNYQGSNYQLALWDTAGQEDYERLRPLSYPGTNVFLLCFSVANLNSYQNISAKWYPEIKEHAPKVPFVLVGTKSDLRPNDKVKSPWYRPKCIDSLASQSEEAFVTTEMGRELARKLNASGYIECSAKSLIGIEEVILEAVKAGIGDEVKKTHCSIV